MPAVRSRYVAACCPLWRVAQSYANLGARATAPLNAKISSVAGVTTVNRAGNENDPKLIEAIH